MCTPTRHLPSPKASTDSASSKSRAVGGSMLKSLNSNKGQLEGQFYSSIFKANHVELHCERICCINSTKDGCMIFYIN